MIKIYRLGLILTMVLLLTASAVQAEAVLTIVGARVESDHPVTHHQCKITFTVRNIGNEAVPGKTSFGVQVWSSNANGVRTAGDYITAIPWYQKNIRALAPNESQDIEAVVTLNSVGIHTAEGIIVNETFPMDQLRIENGNLRKIFNVFQPPDLVLQRVTLNHQGRLTLVMYNNGARIPNEQFNNSIISIKAGAKGSMIPLRNAVDANFKLAARGAMLGGPIRYTYRLPPGGQFGFVLDPATVNKVEATLDYHQSIGDSNRLNNIKKVELGGKPDLVVCFKKSNHNKPHRNAYYPPYVKNIGYATSDPSKLRFWIEDDGAKTYNVPALDPGAEYKGVNRKVYWIRTKFHKFRLTADFGKAVEEFDENNNIIEGKIVVGTYGNNSQTRCSNAPGMRGFN